MPTSPSRKVLIIDDSSSMVAAIRTVLADHYLVESAPDGREGVSLFQRFHPDVVLLDIEMPGPNGYEVCKKLRGLDANGFVKIIMVSVRTNLEERLKGYEAGADDYIGKPFAPEEILAKIRVFCRLKTVETELYEVNRELNRQVAVRTEQLLTAEKMAALGRYAAGIVHNLNNPIQTVLWIAHILAENHPESKHVALLRRAALEMKNIIRTILSTSHQEANADYGPVDLNQVLRDQMELMKANLFFKNRVRLSLELNALPPIQGVYSHFSQISGNLIKNAVEAMYDSLVKVLTVTTHAAADEIRIRISDTGCGISPERIPRIFDPFFTTKPLSAADGRPTGTGLGLASAREMIESYGGKIELSSDVGRGTTFTVFFPLKNVENGDPS